MSEERSEHRSSTRRGLGRGLGALIVNTDPQRDGITTGSGAESQAESGVLSLPLASISPNPQQPRSAFDEDSLGELAASIREHGIIQPLIVTKDPERDNHYWLVAGERRLRAAQMAHLAEAPSIVREASEQQLLELALVENVQRADLNALEEAAAYRILVDRFGLTQESIAERVGRSRSAVANTLRLLQLPAAVQQALIGEEITAGHARAMLALPDEALMADVLQRVVARGLNVRQTEELVKRLQAEADAQTAGQDQAEEADLDPHIRYLEDRFRDALGTRVNLNRNRDGSGRLVVHFYNDEDLQGLLNILTEEEDL